MPGSGAAFTRSSPAQGPEPVDRSRSTVERGLGLLRLRLAAAIQGGACAAQNFSGLVNEDIVFRERLERLFRNALERLGVGLGPLGHLAVERLDGFDALGA